MCKHCADENLFCIHCGYTIDEPSHTNLFLVQLMVSWFPTEYQSGQHKLDAKNLFESEDYELALNEIDTCISLVKNDYSAFQLRAEIYLKLEEYQSALSDASISCELNPECGKTQFLRGSCFSHLGKLNNAIDAFQLCLELEPEDMALCNLVINKLDSILSLPDTGAELGEDSSDEETACKKAKVESPDEVSPTSKTFPETIDRSCTNTDEQVTGPSCSSSNINSQLTGEEAKSNDNKQTENETNNEPETIHGVPKALIKENDFECRLCFELLFKPITTTCGHVFCKSCLLRSLDHNVACPICRMSLAELLRNMLKPVTKIIEEVLELFFEEEYNSRKEIHFNRMERLSRFVDLFSIDFLVPTFILSRPDIRVLI